MTILPKKKEKQESDSDDGNTSHCALSHGGAAAHGTPHRSSDGEESFAHDTDAYYHRYGAHMVCVLSTIFSGGEFKTFGIRHSYGELWLSHVHCNRVTGRPLILMVTRLCCFHQCVSN